MLDYKGNLTTSPKTFVIKVTGPSYPCGTLMELTNSTPLVLKGLIYGQYTIEELNTKNYTVTITAPVTRTGGAINGTSTVRNQEKDKSLPVTGESTRGYTIMGAAIMALSRFKGVVSGQPLVFGSPCWTRYLATLLPAHRSRCVGAEAHFYRFRAWLAPPSYIAHWACSAPQQITAAMRYFR